MFGWFKKKAQDAPTASGPDAARVQTVLFDLLKAHGLDARRYKEWVCVGDELPAIRGFFEPGVSNPTTTGMFAIEVQLGQDRWICDRYGGSGESLDEAFHECIKTFCQGAFHVFLSAFWNCHEPDHVMVESWQIGDRSWQVYIGNYIRKATNGVDVPVPADLFLAIKDFVKAQELDDDVHFLSTYMFRLGEQIDGDAILDTGQYPAFIHSLMQLDWPVTDAFYSVRNAIVLKPQVKH